MFCWATKEICLGKSDVMNTVQRLKLEFRETGELLVILISALWYLLSDIICIAIYNPRRGGVII